MANKNDNHSSIDPLLIQMLLRRRRALASSRNTQNTVLEAALLLMDDDEDNIHPPNSHGSSKAGKHPKVPGDFEGSYSKLIEH